MISIPENPLEKVVIISFLVLYLPRYSGTKVIHATTTDMLPRAPL